MNPLRLACFSDIHLGHRNNSAFDIILALDQLIHTDKLLEKIDLLVFAGDVFDRLLDLGHPNLADIDNWIARLLYACQRHNVVFRVLEGTPSHDRKQSERFVTIHQIINSTVDFKYITTLEIEYHTGFDAYILYIPDEYKPTTDETLADVRELLSSRGLDTVDIAVMHGQFEYQLPVDIKTIPCHDSHAYQELVNYLILIGHVHTHSRNGKIIAQGSTDRLKHGEEEPKGYVYVEIEPDEKPQVYFIENKLARIYKTFKCYGMELDATLTYLAEKIHDLPGNAAIRVEAEPSHPLFSNMNEVMKMYPTLTWSKLAKDQEDDTLGVTVQVSEFDDWHPVHISRDNVVSILMDRINIKVSSKEDCDFIQQQLEELK